MLSFTGSTGCTCTCVRSGEGGCMCACVCGVSVTEAATTAVCEWMAVASVGVYTTRVGFSDTTH
eukprot:349682-Chlamydomonas_euryale.AAC.27